MSDQLLSRCYRIYVRLAVLSTQKQRERSITISSSFISYLAGDKEI